MNQRNKTTTANLAHISLLLLTHNNASTISKYLNWLDQCPRINQIIVIDDHSTDNTQKIITNLSSKKRQVIVKSRGLANDFGAQRQFGLTQAINNWILWLDPDEEVNRSFIQFLNHFDQTQYNYSVKRVENFVGHTLHHGETPSLNFIRLFHRQHGHFVGHVHEIWCSSKPIIQTNYSLHHHSNNTLTNFYQKINLYSSIRAQELFEQHLHTNAWQIFFYPLGKFVQNYFFRFGFLDSTPGIIFALGMSFHSFLVRAKLWHLWQK